MELPLFPLRLVLFPGRPLPLHLFEPRYRQMLTDVLETDRRFGVVAIRQGHEVSTSAQTFGVGTIAQIEAVSELPDGRFDITTRGTDRFEITGHIDAHPYRAATVITRPNHPTDRDAPCVAQLRRLLIPYLRQMGAPEELIARLPGDPTELSFLAASAAQVDLVDQQRLLELDEVAERIGAVVGLLQRESSLMRHFGTVGALRPLGPGGAELN